MWLANTNISKWYHAIFRLSAGKSQKIAKMLDNANIIEEKRC